jgi:hypothetical protein
MEAVRKIVDGRRLMGLVSLPKSFLDQKVEILIFPVQRVPVGTQKKARPRLTMQMIDSMLPGSVTESLIGALPLKDVSLEEMRSERLQKYEYTD